MYISQKEILNISLIPQTQTILPIARGVRARAVMAAQKLRIEVWRPRDLASELLERLALRFRDQEGGEQTAEHKEGENLHDVVQPGRGGLAGCACDCAAGAERAEDALGDDGADLSGSGREAVGG